MSVVILNFLLKEYNDKGVKKTLVPYVAEPAILLLYATLCSIVIWLYHLTSTRMFSASTTSSLVHLDIYVVKNKHS